MSWFRKMDIKLTLLGASCVLMIALLFGNDRSNRLADERLKKATSILQEVSDKQTDKIALIVNRQLELLRLGKLGVQERKSLDKTVKKVSNKVDNNSLATQSFQLEILANQSRFQKMYELMLKNQDRQLEVAARSLRVSINNYNLLHELLRRMESLERTSNIHWPYLDGESGFFDKDIQDSIQQARKG